MIRQLLNKLLLLAIAVLFLVSCENRDKPKDATLTDSPAIDTTANEAISSNGRPAYDASLSVTTIAPDLYKQLADTLGIRVLEATYKPGDSTLVHAHPDFAMYVLDGSMVELTLTNGTKQNIEFQKGMGIVLPAESHSAKNIGKTTLRLVVVEVDRPR
jgi:quercetin dioxygenase-like cupin family protein